MSARRFLPSWIVPSALLLLAATATARVQEPPERPITAEQRAHWAFVAPGRPEVPDVRNPAWIRDPIDAFVLGRLEAAGLPPAPVADRATLLRRLSFDLTGLPPTPGELADFLGDPSPAAYERRVDRLLASPRFGERWAQHWLDLARYADSDGFEFDAARPDAWRYRDWVVDALNADLPFDRFLTLQMAGDEVEPDDPDAAIATGFHRAYPDMVDHNDQAFRRQNALDDITETTGLAFLGLTIGCAKCHDHKADPIRQADFYRLQAFFTPARFRDDYPIAGPAERAAHDAAMSAWRRDLAAAQARLIAAEAPARERLAPGPPPGLDDTATAAFARAPEDRSPEEIGLVFEALSKDKRIKKEALEDASDRGERGRAIAGLDMVRRQKPAPLPQARVLGDPDGEAPPTFLRKRGDFYAPGPEVAPGFPAVLDDAAPTIKPTDRSTGRRAALADWLTRPDHPLTARVIVNRLWERHFGRGLVSTPSDFGAMGESPSHPELLDSLAIDFVESGWRPKAMHRRMLLSATYRQSTRPSAAGIEHDPENTLVWRQARRRLDAEAIRDALLSVSGRLNPAIGGPAVFPDLPKELAAAAGKGAGVWPTSPREEDRNRRSLYVFVRRNLRFPFFEAFDRPDTNASCPRRPVTTIAPQALSLLNGPLAFSSARAMAKRVSSESGPDTPARIDRAFRLALGRPPAADESARAAAFLAEGRGEEGLADFCLALLNTNEFIYID